MRERKRAMLIDGTCSDLLLVGDKAISYYNKLVHTVDVNGVTEVSGVVAQPGKAKGQARVISSVTQVVKFKPSEVLISPMTSPAYLSAIHRAAAIVTDEGGLTSHAAIISRELGIPCIVGTKIATQVFKDGDRVEVDAIKGIIKKLS